MSPSLAHKNRDSIREELSAGVDLLVVGGGINGAGILRDAAMRGLRVGLCEKNDFGHGTSSRSSKLIHGGIRYLEHLDFGLIIESCAERARLMRLEPDLVKPTEFLMPVYKSDRYPLWYMNIGLWMYDALAFFRNHKLHRLLNKKEALATAPRMNPEGLSGGLTYYDCRVNDARLVMNNIVSAQLHGGHALNYMEITGVKKHNGKICGATAVDRLSGASFTIPCSLLVSAAGPWTNGFYETMEGATRDILRLTKGIHLLFTQERFPAKTAVVILSNDDRRIIFVIPWEEYTLVGTTDTDYSGSIDDVTPDQSDVGYLLKLVNDRFPGLGLVPRDAVSAYAGLRPLLLSGGSASAVSRKDKVLASPSGALIVGGGKLTTYRKIAEKAVNMALKRLPAGTRQRVRGCTTARVPLIERMGHTGKTGAYGRGTHPFDAEVIEYLETRYGKKSSEIFDIAASDPTLSQRICRELPFIFAEIIYAARREMLVSLTDFFRLRTEIFLKASDNGLSRADQCARILGSELMLGEDGIRKEADSYRSYVTRTLSCIGRGAVCSDANP
ncbi:MAG: hypothetical protein A2487_15260 [Candidatus Raymondbacteria bacterium RifOxyC12_full_50_8]|nr:MAG: hypothetical protein A2248_05095 [Candidatus Raymondbacteria bacterium RIFOXYA2_FULL_49_16]OGJ94508.1 MAG: hypothetical protein A2487_15260 [Candidatus Raymondbacteria bacterium RifOxyC12_full_50_8]OGJ99280.1 MAG: hypothetical protein A2350_05395 [Candidatus Raymondbacteria bacterium RifOxyB12_full_50_8]OGP43366.1 MAG: hypothetical protein A2324_02735 [Candidatus Raymondbacteria bacterium RIFOXYB2_FULL_49_35]